MHLCAGSINKFGNKAMSDKTMKISFIGGGNMGEAIIASLIIHKLVRPEDISVADINSERQIYLKQKYGLFATDSNLEAAVRGEAVLLAVKPQQLDEVAQELKGSLKNDQFIISIIAGKKLSVLRQGLGHELIVRAMPNTPAQIGRGMTVWTATEPTSAEHRTYAETLLSTMGRAIYTPNEAVLDMATAVSGSGPAYVFLFMEALIAAGQGLGLTPELSRLLTLETVLGATEYARESGKDLDELRRNVTSPGGTTAAALRAFEEGKFTDLIGQAVNAAYQRAQELGSPDRLA